MNAIRKGGLTLTMAALLGVGVGLASLSGCEKQADQGTSLSDQLNHAGDQAKEAGQKAGDALHDAAEKTKEKAGEAADNTKDAAQDAADKANDAMQ